MDAAEDMQIMCFGDVYVPSTTPEKAVTRSVVDEREDSNMNMSTIPSPATAPIIPPPVRVADMPSSPSSQPPSPCQSAHHAQARAIKRKGSIRSFFMPTTFRGKLIQCLVSIVLLGASLAAYLTLTFTKAVTRNTQTIFILLILATGIFSLHNSISLFLFCIQRQRAPLLPTTNTCENEKDCEYCKQTRDALPRDDSLYAPNAAIRVHLCRDEDLKNKKLHTPHVSNYSSNNASQMSLALPSPPPAYGAWRCSVRADPDLLHWHKVDATAGDLAAQTEPEFMEEIPLSPTVAEAWRQQDAVVSQSAVRVSIGRVSVKPAVVSIRASGNWSGRGSLSG